MKQQFEQYTQEDFDVWETLSSRQEVNLKDKACTEYLSAIDDMKEVLYPGRIAEFSQLNDWFETRTGWTMYCVPGLIPVDKFFELLAKKQFCSSTWLRNMEQLDYLEEPDMFHDVFGHVPLLSNSVFSEFIHEFGKLGVQNIENEERLIQLQRLYWFTIEFGLIDQNGPKVYGAGIASSFGESIYSLDQKTARVPFDLDEVLTTFFETDKIQEKYFVIESMEQLYQAIIELKSRWK
ncbi:MAG: phenylalanine-4-hydroxylase [Crocinitomicaceae bacterium]|nr:phenylalanine-4-hydroxylase [Flavobacteriales bacterium]NQZ36616.1 phenylalanine-4-hydroxylase [Crocinitomicaceae bacterium]